MLYTQIKVIHPTVLTKTVQREKDMLTIEEILKLAKEMGASDVHLTVGVPPKARVRGKLLDMDCPKMISGDILDILIGIMPESRRERFEERGEYDTSFSVLGLGRFRVHAYKQRGLTALAIRLMDAEVPSPETLGIPRKVLDLCQREKGLILVTGASGSGRSTTLAAMIDMINNNRYCHIVTLEDPVEYLHCHKFSMVSQREIGVDSDSYASALRAALREDPDVILVGALRDAETVSEALTAAETGHLVLSAMYTADAAGTLQRIIDLYPAHQQVSARMRLADALEAVVSQRLIPTEDGAGHMADFRVVCVDDGMRSLIREGQFQKIVH